MGPTTGNAEEIDLGEMARWMCDWISLRHNPYNITRELQCSELSKKVVLTYSGGQVNLEASE